MVGSTIVTPPAAGTVIDDEPCALAMAQLAVTFAVCVNVPPDEFFPTSIWTVSSLVAPGGSGPMSFQVNSDLLVVSAAGFDPRILKMTPRDAVMLSTTLTPVRVQPCGLCTSMT